MQTYVSLSRVPGSIVGDLWSPHTDAGVIAQIIVTLLVIIALSWFARRERAVVQLIIGVGMVVLAWYGIRAIH